MSVFFIFWELTLKKMLAAFGVLGVVAIFRKLFIFVIRSVCLAVSLILNFFFISWRIMS